MELHINGFTRHEWYIILQALHRVIDSIGTAQETLRNGAIIDALETEKQEYIRMTDKVTRYFAISGGV